MMNKPFLLRTLLVCTVALNACTASYSGRVGDPMRANLGRLEQSGSAEGSAEGRVLLENRRSTGVAASERITATGYAVIGVQNSKVPAQQRLMAIRAARIDAYRGLAEQVYGIYLDSTTTVADMSIKSDGFRARVEGVVHGATLESIAPVNNDTYQVTLMLERTAVQDLRLLYLEQLAAKRR
jgi:hypothetical protein